MSARWSLCHMPYEGSKAGKVRLRFTGENCPCWERPWCSGRRYWFGRPHFQAAKEGTFQEWHGWLLFLLKQSSSRGREGDNGDAHTTSGLGVDPFPLLSQYSIFLDPQKNLHHRPEEPTLGEMGMLKTESPTQALQQRLYCKTVCRK